MKYDRIKKQFESEDIKGKALLLITNQEFLGCKRIWEFLTSLSLKELHEIEKYL